MGQPHDRRNAEFGAQDRFDLHPGEQGIAVRMEQTLFGGHQGADAVDGDRPTLEDDGNRPHLVTDQLGVSAGNLVIVGEQRGFSPGVERPIKGDTTIAVGHVDRPGITEPRVVDRQLDDVDACPTRFRRPLPGTDVGDHRDGLKVGDRAGHRGVRRLGVGEHAPVKRLPCRPAHHRPLVPGGFRRHAHHVSEVVPSSVSNGP